MSKQLHNIVPVNVFLQYFGKEQQLSGTQVSSYSDNIDIGFTINIKSNDTVTYTVIPTRQSNSITIVFNVTTTNMEFMKYHVGTVIKLLENNNLAQVLNIYENEE